MFLRWNALLATKPFDRLPVVFLADIFLALEFSYPHPGHVIEEKV